MSRQDHDDDLEDKLLRWGRAAREGVTDLPTLQPAGRVGVTRQRMSIQLAGGAALVVLAAAIVIVLPGHLGRRGVPAAPSLGGVNSTAHAGAGERVVTFHGLSITVPSSWALTVGDPCSPKVSTVELPGQSDACGHGATPALTFVEFGDGGENPIPVAGVRSRQDLMLDGVAATRVEGVLDRPVLAYVVPSLQVDVVIRPGTDAVADMLARTLAVNSVDSHGCRSSVNDVRTLTGRAPAQRKGASGALIPPGPAAVTLCRYVGGRLEQGARLTGGQLRDFVAALNAQPAGLSRSTDRVPASACKPPSGLGSVNGATVDDSQAYRLEASYPAGPSVVVAARLGWCGALGASNGSLTAQRTVTLVGLLTGLVGDRVGEPGGVVTAT
ncbi:MAG TPA: hypothetical protein VMB79_12350 [Jatrophihabitans sp.]|nr:hypothetical protein [Jatrophihabitans sp.]